MLLYWIRRAVMGMSSLLFGVTLVLLAIIVFLMVYITVLELGVFF